MMVATQADVQVANPALESTEDVLKINYHNLKKAALVLRAIS
jgi:hypothetical protein